MPHSPNAGINSDRLNPLLLHPSKTPSAHTNSPPNSHHPSTKSQNSTANTSVPTNGTITLTDKPSLGIDLNEAALAKLAA